MKLWKHIYTWIGVRINPITLNTRPQVSSCSPKLDSYTLKNRFLYCRVLWNILYYKDDGQKLQAKEQRQGNSNDIRKKTFFNLQFPRWFGIIISRPTRNRSWTCSIFYCCSCPSVLVSVSYGCLLNFIRILLYSPPLSNLKKDFHSKREPSHSWKF